MFDAMPENIENRIKAGNFYEEGSLAHGAGLFSFHRLRRKQGYCRVFFNQFLKLFI